jgi:hypothetical protein|tara:strand:- start:219 stop:443 length:225 start_codon:yes stop_codon:yes gene_type:complete
MSKTNEMYYDDAEKLIDQSIQKVKEGADQDTEINKLMEYDVITTYFMEDELQSIFGFELQDHRMYTNIVTKRRQ